MRILVFFCGGTIVMEKTSDGSYAPPAPERAQEVLNTLEPRIGEIADIEMEYIDNIDSTNMRPEHWDRMAGAIESHYADYDGFVITHGTDTLSYTASALSFAIRDLGKPVVLTGSQIPANEVETDARRNYINAIRVACTDLAGIYVVFDEEIVVGVRSTKVSESKLNAFETVNEQVMGELRTEIRFNRPQTRRHNRKPICRPGFEPNIAVETLYPGLPADALLSRLRSGTKGLVMRGYGAGNEL